MLRILSDIVSRRARHYSDSNPYTNIPGLARSMLALSTLTTLLCNDWSLLFPEHYEKSIVVTSVLDKANLFHLAGYANLDIALWFSVAVLGAVISGILPQVTCFFHFWVTFSFFRYCPIVEGGDQIASIVSMLLIPVMVFDNRSNHWHKPKSRQRSLINIWGNMTILFIQVQVAVVYFHAFAGKLVVEEWINGTATYYWFTHNIFGFSSLLQSPGEMLMKSSFIVTSTTWGTLLLEILLFAALFMSERRRLYLLYAGIFFHFGIVVVHGLLSFFFSMTACLIIYLHPAFKPVSYPAIAPVRFFRRLNPGFKFFKRPPKPGMQLNDVL
jgi:antimicrobial peptide system SdpB family protein